MNDNTRNEFASYGLAILKRSVLLVLYEERVSQSGYRRFMRLKQVRERLGIQQVIGKGDLVRSILDHLIDDGYVEYTPTDRWEITPEGVLVIEG